MAETADVVVVGAGVVGCSVAYYLSRQGADVKLVEREGIGSGASTHATGFLSLLGAEFSQGPSFEFALSAYREFPDLVKDLEESTGIDLLYQRRPSLRLALEEEEETLIRDLMSWQQESVSVKWIGPDDVHELEPRLTPQIRGAAYENESAQLDSYRLTLALAQAAEKRGMELQLRPVTGLLRDNSRVTGVSTATGDIECGTVVMAAGTWSSSFGESINFQIPVRPLKGERLILRFDGPPLPVLISSPKRGHMISRLVSAQRGQHRRPRLRSEQPVSGRGIRQHPHRDSQTRIIAKGNRCAAGVGVCRIDTTTCRFPPPEPRSHAHYWAYTQHGWYSVGHRSFHQGNPPRTHHWAHNSGVYTIGLYPNAARDGGISSLTVCNRVSDRLSRQRAAGRRVTTEVPY